MSKLIMKTNSEIQNRQLKKLGSKRQDIKMYISVRDMHIKTLRD